MCKVLLLDLLLSGFKHGDCIGVFSILISYILDKLSCAISPTVISNFLCGLEVTMEQF